MADFCKQCSIEMFNEDHRELAGLGDGTTLEPDHGWQALCEGCGPTMVNDEGECVMWSCPKHGKDKDAK
jgi:hypothetical protein